MPELNLAGNKSWVSDDLVKCLQAGVNAGARMDWHEPDEQELTAAVVGRSFDNAGVDGEKVVILRQEGKEIGRANLASLMACAAELLRREGLIKPRERR